MSGASENGKDAIYQRSLSEGISPEEGVEAFRRILSRGTPAQVIVSTKDLRASIEQVNTFTQANLTELSMLIRPHERRIRGLLIF